jgi:hypothetical protein
MARPWLCALSARAIRPEYAAFDAEARFAISDKQTREAKSCECPAILRGVKSPKDCKLFGRACTPETPMGACMVSSRVLRGLLHLSPRRNDGGHGGGGMTLLLPGATVEMAHGGGGMATAPDPRDVCAPFRQPAAGSGA